MSMGEGEIRLKRRRTTMRPRMSRPLMVRSSAVDLAAPRLPERIGRYRIERVLGKGGFGLVEWQAIRGRLRAGAA